VVSELKDFYPEEYTLLEWLAAGRTADYLEFAYYPEYIRHLKEYGLIGENIAGAPAVKLPVVAKYVALEEARREGRRTILRLIPKADRDAWLKRRINSIIDDFFELQRLITASSKPSLFGPNSFPESHRFASIEIAIDEAGFEAFINCCNRCFVEAIENYGKHQGKKNYFWEETKDSYPTLHYALHRIKIYRHQRMHIRLEPGVEAALQKFISQDLENREPRNVEELWFVLQQATLDALLNSLQVEISRLGK